MVERLQKRFEAIPERFSSLEYNEDHTLEDLYRIHSEHGEESYREYLDHYEYSRGITKLMDTLEKAESGALKVIDAYLGAFTAKLHM